MFFRNTLLSLFIVVGFIVSTQPAQSNQHPHQTLSDTITKWVRQSARRTGLSECLIQSVIKEESAGKQHAVSSDEAVGLMQLTRTAAVSVDVNRFVPRQNILGGARYLLNQIERFQSLRLGIAAYNAGPGAVLSYDGIPPYSETRVFTEDVLSRTVHCQLEGSF